ncbi:MAG: DUF4438 domain-containing protein, partial [Erysipelothrix sp.]|nr:DUF4438 domain-containing protein [Erysipelothrix sp.]
MPGNITVPMNNDTHRTGTLQVVRTVIVGMTRDPHTLKEFNLDQLRFGDIVFIEDHTNNHGPDYLKGSGTVGVIIHGDSYIAGHGP